MQILVRFFVLFSALLIAAESFAAEYHVSPSGNDNNSGLQGSHWRTIGKANSALQPGDTVYLHTGVYTDNIAPTASGSAGKPITYMAAAGESPVIDKGKSLNGGWTLFSGTDGVNAIYRKQGSHSTTGMIREDDIETNGRNTLYWNRGYQTTKETPQTWVIDRPGEYYHQGGFFYVRTTDSRHPDTHQLIELLDIAIQVSNRSYIVIDGLTIQNVQKHVDASNANHITIQNCTLQYSKGYAGLNLSNSDYWIVRNNTIRGHGSINAHKGDLFIINNSDYSLIEGNRISYNSHLNMKVLGTSKYTVIRGNHFSKAFGKIITIAGSSIHTLIEDNDITEAPIASMLVLQHNSDHTGLQIGGEHVIVRFNRFYNGSGGLTLTANDIPSHGELRDFIIVHNVIADNQGTTRPNGDAVTFYKTEVRRPLIANNIFANNKTTGGKGGQIGFSSGTFSQSVLSGMQAVINNNIIYSSSNPNQVFQDSMSVSDFQRDWGAYAKNNLAVDPKMHSAQLGYALTADSPAIDAGQFLTVANSNGSGNQIAVADARPFYDGFTIEGGDWIRVGGQLARVTNADYANNVLTVDRTLTWQSGAGVSYDYQGQRPDIGAREYSGEVSTTQPKPPSGLIATL